MRGITWCIELGALLRKFVGYLRHSAWSMYSTLNGISKATYGRTLLQLVEEDPEKAWKLIRNHINEQMLEVLARSCCGASLQDLLLHLHTDGELGGQSGFTNPERRIGRIKRMSFNGFHLTLHASPIVV